MLLQLQGLPAPIEFCPESGAVADGVGAVLTGWPISRQTSSDGEPVFMQIFRDGADTIVRRTDCAWETREPSHVSAVCSAIVEIVEAYVTQSDRLGALHAGAVAFDGRLVLFPASTRAGKSTLMTRLAAGGHKVFSDDLLPIELATGMGISTGCLPRPRLPLPANATPAFSAFVKDHLHLTDGYFGYVDPGLASRPTFGESLPAGAVVMLSRSETPCDAHMEAATPEQALWALVSQETRRALPAESVLDSYLNLVGGLKCLRLHYYDLEDAVQCLEAAFATWDLGDGSTAKPIDVMPASDELVIACNGIGPIYRHAPQTILRTAGSDGFLIHRETNEMHNLNQMGLAIWRVLEQPVAMPTIVGLFAEAFPDVDATTIAADIDATLSRMLELGLLVEHRKQPDH